MLDLPAYLARIHLQERQLAADFDSLKALQRAHLSAIPFENIEVLLQRPVRLDLESLQQKLVQRRRGGYCFEHNTLFAEVLKAVGFALRPLAARVVVGGRPAGARTHMLLLVEGRWLADVGFGGPGFFDPIPFAEGEYQAAPGTTFRLSLDDGEWLLSSDLRGPIYRFGLERQLPVDFELYNYYMSTHPDSIMTSHLLVQRYLAEGSVAIFDRTLSRFGPEGVETVEFESLRPLQQALRQEFELEIADDPRLLRPKKEDPTG